MNIESQWSCWSAPGESAALFIQTHYYSGNVSPSREQEESVFATKRKTGQKESLKEKFPNQVYRETNGSCALVPVQVRVRRKQRSPAKFKKRIAVWRVQSGSDGRKPSRPVSCKENPDMDHIRCKTWRGFHEEDGTESWSTDRTALRQIYVKCQERLSYCVWHKLSALRKKDLKRLNKLCCCCWTVMVLFLSVGTGCHPVHTYL